MATQYQERKYRDPALNPGDERYFEAAAEGKLLIKKCNDCGKNHHYPRALCPFCFSDKVEWVQAKGTGEIYTYSVTRRGSRNHAGAEVGCLDDTQFGRAFGKRKVFDNGGCELAPDQRIAGTAVCRDDESQQGCP